MSFKINGRENSNFKKLFVWLYEESKRALKSKLPFTFIQGDRKEINRLKIVSRI
jgi:hypothetical protein